MRTRTGHGPDDWSPNEPATPHRFSRSFSSDHVEVIGSMQPVMKYGPVVKPEPKPEKPR